MKKTRVALLCLISALTAQAYEPVGVQLNVPYSTVADGGWELVYEGGYEEVLSLDVLFAGVDTDDMVMFAAKNSTGASGSFTLLATAPYAEMTQYTPLNTPQTINGANWYWNGQSVGFCKEGDSISQGSADTSDVNPDYRLSWHSSGGPDVVPSGINSGWRAGSNLWLGSPWRRYVFKKSPYFFEGFEADADSGLSWSTSGDSTWFQTTPGYAGSVSYRSGVITHGQTCSSSFTATCVEGGISFWFKTSTEGWCDYLRFYIDDVEQKSWAGILDWQKVTFPVSAGSHTFKWAYTKDGSVNTGLDCVWIDDIQTFSVVPPENVSATAGTTTDGVQMSWESVTGADKYQVYRADSVDGARTAVGSWVTTTSCTDTTAAAGQNYFYWVKVGIDATTGTLESDYSESVTGYRAISAPSVSATDGTNEGQVQVSWNTVSGAGYYKVYRANSIDGAKTAVGSWVNTQSVVDSTAVPETIYYYFVTAAVDSSGTYESSFGSSDTGYSSKITPTVSRWPVSSAVIYGQSLSVSVLSGGSASVSGSFAFVSPADTPIAGTASHRVRFTPTDSANYNAVDSFIDVAVNVVELTVVGASANNKVYDGNSTASITGGSLAGVVSDDAVLLSSASAGTFEQATIGSGIEVTSAMTLTGADAENYSIAQPKLTADITAKGLAVINAVAADKVYDGTTAATIAGGALVGLIDGDIVSLADTATGIFAQAGAGSNIVVTSSMTLAGADADNYTLSQPALSAEITKANQHIRFSSISEQTVLDTVGLLASARSDLPVSFNVVSGPGVLDGTNLSFAASGPVLVAALQAGNSNWNAAATTNRVAVIGVITNVTPAVGSLLGGDEIAIDGIWLGNGNNITNVSLCGVAAAVVSQTVDRVFVTSGLTNSAVEILGDVIVDGEFGTMVMTNAFTYRPVPRAPTALSAVDITDSQFVARWASSDDTTTHCFIDVSESTNFTSMVGIYSNWNAGNVSSCLVTGLSEGTTCFYRVRAANQYGSSLDSNLIETPVSANTSYVKQQITNGVASAGSSDVLELSDLFNGTEKSYQLVGNSNSNLVTATIDEQVGALTLEYTDGQSGTATLTVRQWDEPDYQGFYVDTDITVYVTDSQPAWSVGPVALNLANGLFEQVVHVTNTASVAAQSVTLTVSDITEGASLYNATGTDAAGNYEIQWGGTLAAGGNMDFTLQYYTAQTGMTPTGTVSVSFSLEQPEIDLDNATQITLTGTVQSGSRFVIGFNAVIGKTYIIQYADTASGPWQTARSTITALTKQLQWIDSGPPVTTTPGNSRVYRVFQAD